MKVQFNYIISILIGWIPLFGSTQQSTPQIITHVEADSIVFLKNTATLVGIDLNGGAFVNFQMEKKKINPFTWQVSKDDMPENNRKGASFKGHFLCLGRWGSPTAGEIKAGIPFNGEPGNMRWTVNGTASSHAINMSAIGKNDGISVLRNILLDHRASVFMVKEEITNTKSTGRLFNIVQHATIGSPLLDSSTIIDSNAGYGFMQSLSYPSPYQYEYTWPDGFLDSVKSPIDLRLSSGHNNYVSTHLIMDSIGWVTAVNPTLGILLGYVWKKIDYPWVNIWQQNKDGRVWAKGLEFGTTGIGKSYQELLDVDTRFHGYNSFFYLDAGETISKSFLCFQLQIPADFKGVESVHFVKGKIRLRGKNKQSEDIEIATTLSLP